MQVDTRPMTEEERRFVSSYGARSKKGCISGLAFYGGYLILLPFVIGGFIGAALFLLLNVSEVMGQMVGLIGAFITGLTLLIRSVSAERKYDAQLRQRRSLALENGSVEVHAINPVRWWDVQDWDEDAEVYFVDCGHGEYLFVSTNEPLNEDFDQIPSKISIEIIPALNVILRNTADDSRTLPRTGTIDCGLIPLDEEVQFQYLMEDRLPNELLKHIGRQ